MCTYLTAMASDPISMHFFNRIGSSITNWSCQYYSSKELHIIPLLPPSLHCTRSLPFPPFITTKAYYIVINRYWRTQSQYIDRKFLLWINPLLCIQLQANRVPAKTTHIHVVQPIEIARQLTAYMTHDSITQNTLPSSACDVQKSICWSVVSCQPRQHWCFCLIHWSPPCQSPGDPCHPPTSGSHPSSAACKWTGVWKFTDKRPHHQLAVVFCDIQFALEFHSMAYLTSAYKF